MDTRISYFRIPHTRVNHNLASNTLYSIQEENRSCMVDHNSLCSLYDHELLLLLQVGLIYCWKRNYDDFLPLYLIDDSANNYYCHYNVDRMTNFSHYLHSNVLIYYASFLINTISLISLVDYFCLIILLPLGILQTF